MIRSTFASKGTPIRWTKNHVMVIYFYLPIVVFIAAVHTFFLLLDELLFPGYRKVKLQSPLIIVGPPRSGTTFLHRVLAKDTERFTCLMFGEMVWTPSITQRKILAGIAWLDRAVGAPLYRLMRHLEKAWFDPYADMHRVSQFEPEEDFVLLGYCFANHLLMILFPFRDEFEYLYHFDWQASPKEKKRLMGFYHRCLQRHMYFHGSDKIFLSKNPFFTSMMQSLGEELPEPKFLCNIRTPFETVPSFLSVWGVMYGGIGNDPQDYLAHEFVLDWLKETYLYGSDQVAALGPGRGAVALYADLVGNPREAVLGYYHGFGYEPGPAFLKVLEDEEAKSKGYKSKHKYGLEQYGLTEEQVAERFGEVFERFGFPTTAPGASHTFD